MRKAPSKTSAPARAADPSLQSLFDVHEATLPNGLQVRLLANHLAPVVSLYTFFNVGSRNERPGITGISHLFEHMMFNGAKKYGPKMFDKTLESNGGSSNAYTSHDMTVYYDDFSSDALETVLDLESDRMRSLRISQEMLTSEREVVKEERRVRMDNDIGGMMDEELGSLVYKAHAYRWPVIGWMADIEAITREDCQNYFRTYYAPNNAILYIAGDIDPKKTLALVRRYYGDIPRGPAPQPVINAEPEQRGERRSTVRHPAQSPAVVIGYKGPPARDEDTLALDVAQYVLTKGEGSRLTRSLLYEQKVVVGVGLDWSWRIDPGTILFFLELMPDSDPQKAEAALYAELEKLARDGITERELQKALNNLRSDHLRELGTNNGRAHAMGNYEALLGDWRHVLTLPSAYASITREQVQAAVRKYLIPERRSVVTLLPAPSEA
ncbi:pitrilysin family protein [Myxococcus sp. MISCRS1]|uniref:M16 family metallopeptidase n=1 Tax=Myxococcus TaxID=32 RepID=UPI001CC1B134|nr:MULTISPECIES: pitrilysin family protein [unclassified Myxococcus]MBZ4397498.1 insulinase family protein [Myxococcus sp. AS-1-15]MBZ4411127.1 insulinase family protein [Myxococcus sp. XM-1-1-1]MCY1003653.1 pitrilysin family protein [Myxococcus sp. MISCRS1]BDT34736.1 insulinase family protein [Myxococcus sp. MH1]